MPEKTKYGKYVTREIIAESKYPQVTAPMARYNGCRGGGDALQDCEWSCITKPFVMDAEPEVDTDRDQFLLFASSNIEDGDFQAVIELPMGKEKKKQIITEPTYVYIPKGLVHGPVNFKTIKKPVAFLSYYLSPEFSTKWDEPNYSKYLATLSQMKPIMTPSPTGAKNIQEFFHPGGTPFRYMAGMGMAMSAGNFRTPMGWSANYGWPGKVSPAYMVTRNREYLMIEPVHAHKASHQISMYIGSNPLDITDFDGVIEIFMGKEKEMHVIDTCAVDHYVPGIPHLGDEVRRVGKPFIHIMWVIGPYMEHYYKAAAKDKVLLSDLSKGEVMISEGARDYVPPTKMEDYIWPYPKKK